MAQMIAFVAALDRDPDIADKNIGLSGIYVVNIDGSGLRRLQVVKDPALRFPGLVDRMLNSWRG